MADVDIAVPKASIRITPKTPGVIAGTGSVISVPLASIRITPKAPTYQKYPLVELQNVDGLKIYELVFPDINPGTKIEQTLILQNNTSNPINYSFTPTSTEEQVGSDIDTINSTYFSTDGTSWSKSITVEIPADDTITVYVRYQPPSTAFVGEKEWLIMNSHDAFTAPPLEGWLFVGKYPISGSIDGELTDHQVEVVLPYQPIMNTDFSDIRFRTADDVNIPYYEKEKVDEDYCIFTLKVPTILASPNITDVFIYAGNSDATSESSVLDTYIFGDEMEADYEDKWETLSGSYQTPSYTVVAGRNAISFNRTSGCKAKVDPFGFPFKVEFECMATQYNNRILYCQDETPNLSTPERYAVDMDLDDRTTGLEGIRKDNVFISPTQNKYGEGAWFEGLLIVDEGGNHSLQLGNNTPLTVVDNTYTSGYFAIGHYIQSAYYPGVGYFSKLLVSKYTPNPPVAGNLEGWNINQNLQVKGGILWQEPDLEGLDLEPGVKIKIGSEYYE